MSFDLCIFDLDGTLSDPRLGITRAYQHALSAFGINADLADRNDLIGPPLRQIFADLHGFSTPDVEKAVSKFREYFSITGLYENTIYTGIPELLQFLIDNEKTLAVATNKVKLYSEEILKHFDLEKYFAFISGDEMDGSLTQHGKRDIIKIVLDTLNAEGILSAVMIGDRKHDIIGARENGICSVGVTWGYGSLAELEEAGATYIINTPDQLQRFLCR